MPTSASTTDVRLSPCLALLSGLAALRPAALHLAPPPSRTSHPPLPPPRSPQLSSLLPSLLPQSLPVTALLSGASAVVRVSLVLLVALLALAKPPTPTTPSASKPLSRCFWGRERVHTFNSFAQTSLQSTRLWLFVPVYTCGRWSEH